MTMSRVSFVAFAAVALASLSSTAHAGIFTGTVNLLEVWPNGNVAFTINGATLPCNGQVIINQNVVGNKNLFASLLAAKHANKQVRIDTAACAPAQGYYPEVLYNHLNYLTVLD